MARRGEADRKRNTPSVEQQRNQAEADRRREVAENARDAAPWSVGRELIEGSPERKAKQDEAKKG